MKAFSKEWWLNIATTVIRDFELCSFDNGIPHITFRQTYDWDDEDLDLFTNYCFKRYAEAYHREKMEDILIEFMDSIRDYVAESGTNIAHDERDSSEFVEIFMRNKELIEKIKG